jgi:hypothetical protein
MPHSGKNNSGLKLFCSSNSNPLHIQACGLAPTGGRKLLQRRALVQPPFLDEMAQCVL